MLERVLKGERLDHVELVFVPKSGTPITVEGNLSCTFKDGHTLRRCAASIRDITERKRVEEHLRRAERMQAAGKLAGGVAHEVNNMMTGVIGFSEFLLRSLRGGRRRAGPTSRRSSRPAPAPPMSPGSSWLSPGSSSSGLRCSTSTPWSATWRRCCAARWAKTSLWSSGSRPTPDTLRADRGQLEQVLINLVSTRATR